jgi:hypothetical protein
MTAIVGTADRRWIAAADGRLLSVVCGPEDARTVRNCGSTWDRSMSWTGYTGGHFESHVPEFLRYHVLPLLDG